MTKEKSKPLAGLKPADWNEAKIMRFELRVPMSFMKQLDDWRRQQDDLPNRSEAIRRLVEAAVGGAAKPERKKAKSAG